MRLAAAFFQAGMATLSLLIMISVVISNWEAVTHGTSTIIGVPPHATVWSTLVVALLTILGAYLYQISGRGVQLHRRAGSEYAASASRHRPGRWSAGSPSASGFFVALGGAMYAFYLPFASATFYLPLTFLTVAMLIIGGRNSLWGAVVGVVLVSTVSEVLRRYEAGASLGPLDVTLPSGSTEVVLALVMLTVLLLRPDGLTGGVEGDLAPVLAVPSRGRCRPARRRDRRASARNVGGRGRHQRRRFEDRVSTPIMAGRSGRPGRIRHRSGRRDRRGCRARARTRGRGSDRDCAAPRAGGSSRRASACQQRPSARAGGRRGQPRRHGVGGRSWSRSSADWMLAVSCAGVLSSVPLAELGDAEWARNIDINLKGTVNLMQPSPSCRRPTRGRSCASARSRARMAARSRRLRGQQGCHPRHRQAAGEARRAAWHLRQRSLTRPDRHADVDWRERWRGGRHARRGAARTYRTPRRCHRP